MTEASEMTIKKSKTVAFENRAGDLTALYCMSDWMIAVVLAIIAMMSVWAALIIYRSIQTLKGPRRKVEDETEKDGKETTTEEAPLSCVESTEETEVIPEALESWDGEGWKREPMVRIPTIDEDVEPIEGIPTTNEDVEPIEGIPTTNEDLQTLRRRRTTKSDGPYAEFHLCSPPEEHRVLFHHYEGLCQVCGGLCQDDTLSRTDNTLDEEEQATSHHSLSDINSQSGQTKATDLYHPEEEGLKEVDLRNGCQRTEESVASHPLTFANNPQEAPQVNENLPDMLTDSGLQEPDQLSVTEIQEGKCPGAVMMTSHVADYEKSRTMEDDMEAMVEDLYSHFPQVDDCSAGIDPTARMTSNPQEVFDQQPDSLCTDPNRDCVLRDNAMEGLSREPTEARDTHVISEQKGEGVDKSMDTRVESSCQEVEINIMEATMDYNEWMTVSVTDAEGNADTPRVRISHSSDSSAEAKHHPTETQHNADDSTITETPTSKVKEAETTPVSLDGDLQENKMAAVLPNEPHAVQVRFCIHYLTLSPRQELAVTGNQPELGSWKDFVPLERGQDGFWASWVALPAEKLVEWKFVLVENGEIQRWEESENRHLETGHGGGVVNLNRWWGIL
uniref:CBM20 domain-containing protein n=1 Tax=Oncorhynchus tshawytscha TaxID=74940 RepID=A0AAZ3QU20_ONCTS